MLDSLDRHSRDSTLFQFTTKRLRDFIDPNHLLIQIDEKFDFPKLVEPLEVYYCRDNGRLSPSSMSVEEFKEKAVEENGLFVLRERQVDKDGEERESVSYYQDPKGRLCLNPVDTDARWRTVGRQPNKGNLHYQENVIVERGGFIVARTARTPAWVNGRRWTGC